MRSRAISLIAVAALIPCSAAAAARAPSPRAAHVAVMAARTLLSWSGQAGVVFSLRHGAVLQESDLDLTVVGGTYAFVRFVPEVDDQDCPAAYGPRCHSWQFDWIKSIYGSANPADGADGHNHYADVPSPGLWQSPKLDAYLFTDGAATLSMKWSGLDGQLSVRPAGTFRGRAEFISSDCVPLGCATSSGRSNGVMYGGDTFDLRGKGWLDVRSVYASDSPPENAGDQVHGQAYCFFPNPTEPTASPSRQDHPYGCGNSATAGADTTSSGISVISEMANSIPSVSTSSATYWSGATGRVYAGFRADGAGPDPSTAGAYAVWFRYGIH